MHVLTLLRLGAAGLIARARPPQTPGSGPGWRCATSAIHSPHLPDQRSGRRVLRAGVVRSAFPGEATSGAVGPRVQSQLCPDGRSITAEESWSSRPPRHEPERADGRWRGEGASVAGWTLDAHRLAAIPLNTLGKVPEILLVELSIDKEVGRAVHLAHFPGLSPPPTRGRPVHLRAGGEHFPTPAG
ncbi:hypothetical protein GCM10009863_64320 [Streptomyces axinellae]|uniref:Uncharacterized protein n=1 Tax=Streptomyces axinellae TaxID=552788 RepID=A0ABN3QZU7_9ACTN